MNERMTAQLRVIKAVVNTLGAADIPAWLFGGWGLDVRIGRITREHGDVEFWVERVDAGRSKAVLVEAGATALATQPPEESCEFTWDGAEGAVPAPAQRRALAAEGHRRHHGTPGTGRRDRRAPLT